MDSPPIPKPEIKAAGGVLKYWENSCAARPKLARMALDFLSAPGSTLFALLFTNMIIYTHILASSVDAERAFSGGRLQVNHLQHQISSQSFKAQVAVGSWYDSPLLPSISSVAAIINDKVSKGKKKAVAEPVMIEDD